MKSYVSYRRSPLKTYDKGWKISLFTLFAVGLGFLFIPTIDKLATGHGDLSTVWAFTCLILAVVSFILFMVFACGAHSLRKKVAKHSKDKIAQIEITTSRFAQKSNSKAIDEFFDSAFNVSKRERKNAVIIKNYVEFGQIKDTYISSLKANGVAVEEKDAINIISSIFANKFITIKTSDIALGSKAIKALAALSVEVKELDFVDISNVESLVKALEQELGIEELRIVLLKNFSAEKQEILANAIPILNIRYNDIELKYRHQSLMVPSHIVFVAVENLETVKTYSQELRRASTILDIAFSKTTSTDLQLPVCDAVYDYLYRIDSMKGSYKLSEEDWKAIDSLMAIQNDCKLTNKEYVEIERYITILGALGIDSSEFKNLIIAQRILPLIAPIISSSKDKDATKKLKQLIGNKNETLANVLMDYVYEEQEVVKDKVEDAPVDEIDNEELEEIDG